MKSQYPGMPITYQNSEPLNYLATYSGIQQICREKVESLKLQFKQAVRDISQDEPANTDKEEDDSFSSFFYSQSFTPNEDK
jgi:hypothetical protein